MVMQRFDIALFRSMDMEKARTPLVCPSHNTSTAERLPVLRGDHLEQEIHPFVKGYSAPRATIAAPTEKLNTAPTSESSLWAVNELPSVPWGVPLEPTALKLQGISISSITSRICAFMKLNSVGCSYGIKQARVNCTTCCGLRFAVQLWRPYEAGDLKPPNNQIILEVQRRRGCCIMMRSIRRLLYAAVLKNSIVSVKRLLSDCHKNHRHWKRESNLSSAPSNSGHGSSEINTTRCLKLLTCSNLDDQRLGMETLLYWVDCTRGESEQSEEIAQALVFGSGILGPSLRQTFLSILQSPRAPQNHLESEVNSDLDNVSTLECPSWYDHAEGDLQLLCLKFLTACLETLLEREIDYLCNEATTMMDLSSNFWARTVSYMLRKLDEIETKQHEAALAVKSLRILESLQPGLLIPLTHSAIISRAVKAFKFGRQHHLLLERESEKLLESLNLMNSSSQPGVPKH